MSNNDQINESTFHPAFWTRFWRLTWPYWRGPEKRSAWALLIVMLLLSAAVTGLNVYLTFINNYLLTALSTRHEHIFYKWLLYNAGIFVVGTPIVAYAGYVQSKLGVNWRRWLTDRLLTHYFENRAYYAVNLRSNVDNPDQRLTQDAADFTSTSVSNLFTLSQSVFNVIAFIGVLWTISHTLTWFMVVYSVVGTAAVFLFGRRLTTLNFQQQRREANFRYGMVRVRDNTEAIAFYHGEAPEDNQAKSLLQGAVMNYNALIGWQLRLGLFTTAYNYFIAIVPFLVVAPLYFAFKTEIGTVTQAGDVFAQVLGSTTIIVSLFGTLTAYAATVDRLSNFAEALTAPVLEPGGQIALRVSSRLAMERLTVQTPDGERTLVQDLTAQVDAGQGLLIVGPSGSGKSSLLRALAGLWTRGAGTIERPPDIQIMFLPQTPYMVQGSLRRQILYPRQEGSTTAASEAWPPPPGQLGGSVSDAALQTVLAEVGLSDLAERVGGLDAERDWDALLSLGERQRLAFARLLLARPSYAVLDEATSALDPANEQRLYDALRRVCPYYVSVSHSPSVLRHHAQVLELSSDSGWNLRPAQDLLNASSMA